VTDILFFIISLLIRSIFKSLVNSFISLFSISSSKGEIDFLLLLVTEPHLFPSFLNDERLLKKPCGPLLLDATVARFKQGDLAYLPLTSAGIFESIYLIFFLVSFEELVF
jgi:hypothetical protein